MALTFGFYNSIDHDRKYDAIQVGQIFDGIIKDGVYETYKKALIVKESSQDNQVIIQPGRAWFDHTWSYNDADYTMIMPGPESFLDRIDAVVLDINATNNYRRNAFVVVTGEPSASPERPTPIKEAGHNQYPLCYIKRYGGQNKINQADITNVVGTSECPFVVGVVEGLHVDDLIAQWSSEFRNYMDQKIADWDAYQSGMEQTITQYETDKHVQWDAYQANMEQTISDYETAKHNEWDLYESARRTAWDSFQAGMERKIQVYEQNMEQQFFAWMETQKSNYDAFIDHNTIAWNNWFQHIQYELDGDVAGHLQTQIDQIKKFTSIYVVDKVLYVPMSGASVDGQKLIFATV